MQTQYVFYKTFKMYYINTQKLEEEIYMYKSNPKTATFMRLDIIIRTISSMVL